ncbi:uncharacterized protein [Euwallacea fornicatus]|uniref:uncharacterized protein n=1 Tax=Euwallacea fornicatus TaxID=995702 RepID=UPI00338D39CF
MAAASALLSLAIRVASAYSTAPGAAVLVFAKKPPVRLRMEERRMVWKRGKECRSEASEREKEWATYDGRMKVFVPSVRGWFECKWTRPEYALSQVFTGYGMFDKYLRRIGVEGSENYWFCGDEIGSGVDTPEHKLWK